MIELDRFIPLRSCSFSRSIALFVIASVAAHATPPTDEKAPDGSMSAARSAPAGSDTTANEDPKTNAPVVVHCTPSVGLAPLTVIFQVESHAQGEIQEVRYDFAGDHTAVVSKPDLKPVTHVYDQPGEFFPVVTVKTSTGLFSSNASFNFFRMQSPLMIRVTATPRVIRTIPVTDPVDVAVGKDKSLYVLSRSKSEITQYDEKGKPVRSLAAVGTSPSGIGVDPDGKVYVALTGANQIIRLSPGRPLPSRSTLPSTRRAESVTQTETRVPGQRR